MRVVQVNYAFDAAITEADALLDRYATLTGWSGALQDAGVEQVHVVQRFHRDDGRSRDGAEYTLCADGRWSAPPVWHPGVRVARAVAALQPDVVHVNGLGFALPTWVLTRRLPSSTACVVQDHGGGVPQPAHTLAQHAKHAARRQLLAAADAFMFSTTTQAEPWRYAGLIAPRHLVYGALEASSDFRPIEPAAARRATRVAGSPAVLWVGRLNANKDPLTVLAAFERILPALPDARLSMIYSEDPLLPAVMQRIHQSPRLLESVRLLGAVPHEQMPAFYSAADIFVLGSHHEGSGYALIEACACGCVPAVTAIPSFVAIAGASAANWAPGSVSSCADALLRAAAKATSAEARYRMREHFDRELSWTAIGRRARQIYEDVLDRKRHQRLAATRAAGLF